MSGAAVSGAAGISPPHHTSLFSAFSSLGLGFSVVIAVFSLLLLAVLVAASCYCYRSYSRARNRRTSSPSNPPTNPNSAETGVAMPRIIFVTDDDDDDDVSGGGSGNQSPVGLDAAAFSSYPKFPYSKNNINSGGDTACPICLCEYREGEMLRMLPDCRHKFHLLCVDAWLGLNSSCPVCRTSPMPTPISTPLSELVPLSRFPGGQRTR